MGFDRGMPGGGIEVYQIWENGKMQLEIQVFLEEMEESRGQELLFLLYDQSGETVMMCRQPLPQEELCRGILLNPHLWKGRRDPYLYRMEAWLLLGKQVVDCIKSPLALRYWEKIPGKHSRLNGEEFVPQAVDYTLPPQIIAGRFREEQLEQELELLGKLGANTLCIGREYLEEDFRVRCEQMGFVLSCREGDSGKKGYPMPVPAEQLGLTKIRPADEYFYYRAKWSRESFVHICEDSLHRQENGLYQIKVYSNCKKVVLYIEGKLFEFQTGPPEFLFQELQVKGELLQLCAEGESCSMSITLPLR